MRLQAGQIFQVVPSQRFSLPIAADPLDVYRVLRRMNPSPYMYLLRTEDADGEPNLDPDAGVADNDAYDDGWDPTHGLPACERTSITLQISADEVRSGLLPRIDGAVVAHVVTPVHPWRRVEGGEPDRVDADREHGRVEQPKVRRARCGVPRVHVGCHQAHAPAQRPVRADPARAGLDDDGGLVRDRKRAML